MLEAANGKEGFLKKQREVSAERARYLQALTSQFEFQKHISDRLRLLQRRHISSLTQPQISETERAFHAGALSALNDVLKLMNLKEE